MLGSKERSTDSFLTRVRQKDLGVHHLSRSYFDWPKRTIRINSNIVNLIKQTFKDVDYIYRDTAGFDMGYEELKDLCRKAWEEDFQYLDMDRSKI